MRVRAVKRTEVSAFLSEELQWLRSNHLEPGNIVFLS